MARRSQPNAKKSTPTAAEERGMRFEFKKLVWGALFTTIGGLAVYWGTAGVHDLLAGRHAHVDPRESSISLTNVFVGGGRVGISMPANGVDLQASGVKFIDNGTALEVRDGPSSGVSAGAK